GFFLIDWRAILDYMSWRHPSSAIDDPKPLAGSYNMEDVRRLSAHVVKLRDIPKGVLVLFGLSGVWKSQTYDPLWALKISCVFLSRPRLRFKKNLIMILGLLCRGFPSTIPPAATDAAIPQPTLKDLATGTPNLPWLNHLEVLPKSSLFSADSEEESDDDEDAWVEIPLITPIRFVAVIPTNGNHSGGSAPSVAKDSRGKAVMNDVAATPPGQLAIPGLSLVLLLLSEMSLTMLFIGTSSPFLLAPIMPHIPKVELMMRVVDLNDKISTFDAAFAKVKSKGKERKKKIKFLTKNLDQLNHEVALLTRVQGELLSLDVSDGFERGLSVDRTKEELADVLSKISCFVPGAQGRLAKASPPVVTTDYLFLNKVNAMVDMPDNEIVDGAGNDKLGEVFVQGFSHMVPISKRVSSNPNDVVVALSAEEKDSGSLPSPSVAKEATVAPSRV
ncbi:hypothetical protein Tco_1440889, partial [Tanacetum coccineum]